MDPDGDRAEEPRRTLEGDRPDDLRHRRASAGHEVGGGEDMPGVRSAVQFPIPDPALTRGRIFSGGVAVIADTWFQAKGALDTMPIEWETPPANAAFTSANMRESLMAALDRPGTVRARQGDV